MRRISITFRELLERILPLDQLPSVELARVREALAVGSPGELERLAFHLLERLVRTGRVRRLPAHVDGGDRVVRFQLADDLATISLRFPESELPSGLEALPRAEVAAGGTVHAAQLQRLLALHQDWLRDESPLPAGRGDQMRQLLARVRELLDADSVALFPAAAAAEHAAGFAPPAGESRFLGRYVEPAVLHDDRVLVCDDARATPALAAEAERRGIGSAAAVRVRAEEAGLFGHLEARSARAGHFDATRLSLLSLAAHDVERILAQAVRVDHLAYVDALSGLFNRSFFQREIAAETARAQREHAPLALVIADIDDFKRFNTEHGYEAGNEVLRHVARLLQSGVRPFDSVARWGGEEFAVLLSSPVGPDEAAAIAQRLRQAIEGSALSVTGLDRRSHDVRVTVSMGISLFPSDAESPEELWRLANRALLVAKQPPKNRAVFYRDLPREKSA
jgi:diguanylate cyclase (GGDEF)-like protein